MASSYLDLSPLYGSSKAEQDLMRTFKDGMIKPDTFSDRRLELFPPGVAALMVCFNRFHNYIVQQLALVNEGGRFTSTAGTNVDNDLFHTARL
jgi:linoleate 8R-lipoxygenase / 9,12-octadecadienoate 8-hydroperoxide 8R-isomerase